uniref:diacylglycerol O-acyltransferase n=1 Tax=Timema cristinae TaxID=61476 RepID=A0A7R9CQ12_TIMCR|nr:unnamed protein product [Timema cristinae]
MLTLQAVQGRTASPKQHMKEGGVIVIVDLITSVCFICPARSCTRLVCRSLEDLSETLLWGRHKLTKMVLYGIVGLKVFPELKIYRKKKRRSVDLSLTNPGSLALLKLCFRCHRPRDSLFSWSSGFDNFTGLVNWGFLLLTVGGVRLLLENLIKYGIRVDPQQWFIVLTGQHEGGSEHPSIILLMFGASTVCTMYSLLFFKLWSYVQVNLWCRIKRNSSSSKTHLRRQSLSYHNFSSTENVANGLANSKNKPEVGLVQYPDNLNLHDIIYFIFAPTLCYELNFPRTTRIRKRHLYIPLVEQGYGKTFASTVVFFISAFFHEYLVSVPLRTFKIWAFMGMMGQIPLSFVSRVMERKMGPRWGNIVVWASLILGQPLCIMMYYHDYVITHMGKELIEMYGHL